MTEHDILSDAEREALQDVMQEPLLKSRQVLIVDDDQETRELLAEILEFDGIHCLTAESPAHALKLLAQGNNIGLLVTDLRMAPCDGLELVRQIRESEWAALSIIIVSGDANVRDAIDAMHLSVVDFLLKPIDPEYLLKLIRHELNL